MAFLPVAAGVAVLAIAKAIAGATRHEPVALAPSRSLSTERAHVINLDARPRKFEQTRDAWAPFFDVERVSAVANAALPAQGCSASHLSVMRKLLASDAPYVVVLEDDAVPTKNMSGGAWDATVAALLQTDAAVLVCGPSLLETTRFVPQWRGAKPPPAAALFAVNRASLSHMVVYTRRVLPYLDALERNIAANGAPIDKWFTDVGAAVVVCASPYARQRSGHSDIMNLPFGLDADYTLLALHSERAIRRKYAECE